MKLKKTKQKWKHDGRNRIMRKKNEDDETKKISRKKNKKLKRLDNSNQSPLKRQTNQ